MTTPTLVAPREVFGKTLLYMGRKDPRIVVLGADLNKSTGAWAFMQEFPGRSFDLGIAEQNMMSMAAGFAASGKIPVTTTFAVFGTGRPYDQIRLSIAQPRQNVKIVVTHAGLLTGEDGMSAESIEDIALMLALPGFTVAVPSDGPETDAVVRAVLTMEGPAFVRLPRAALPVIHRDGFSFRLGKAETMRPGDDVAIVACGALVAIALAAAEHLAREGVQARVVNLATLAPLDEEGLAQAARETGAVVTAEEHFIRGGLNSVVSQALAARAPVPVEAVALRSYGESGKPTELFEKYGLTPANIVAAAKRAIARKR
ncbi:MAG: transketolase family protein [SAR202 cluster bacterium]|nr:transketolase family protein [SAR202 cluster bacterium]